MKLNEANSVISNENICITTFQVYVNNYLQSEHAHSADFKSPAKLRFEVDNTAGKLD